jgi:hypothetical protein
MKPLESSGFGANLATAPLISNIQSSLLIETIAAAPNIMSFSPAAHCR